MTLKHEGQHCGGTLAFTRPHRVKPISLRSYTTPFDVVLLDSFHFGNSRRRNYPPKGSPFEEGPGGLSLNCVCGSLVGRRTPLVPGWLTVNRQIKANVGQGRRVGGGATTQWSSNEFQGELQWNLFWNYLPTYLQLEYILLQLLSAKGVTSVSAVICSGVLWSKKVLVEALVRH